MSLNNILASPSFQSWIEGEPLDIASMLYTPQGKPRHTVFYIAHLQETERMFFVTLLFSAVEAWMRSQPGTPSLRSLVYFDEIFGYLPPISNPPSKPVMMRMLKQARAFGIGLVLATQNPADVDYKGLSNTGTWFVGKLQTDQDKQRLLDGLEGAVAGSFNRSEFDKLISGLGKRVFLLHNVHDKAPRLFGTRWAMNYLAGPLTRTQIPELNNLAGLGNRKDATVTQGQSPRYEPEQREPGTTTKSQAAPTALTSFSATKPAVPAGAEEYFFANNLTFSRAFKAAGREFPPQAQNLGLVYRPVLFAQASVRFQNRRYNLSHELTQAALVENPDRRGMVRWEDYLSTPVNVRALESRAEPGGRFAMLESPLSDEKGIRAMEKDFQDWLYHNSRVTVRANETLKIFAGPDVPDEEFKQLCTNAAKKLGEAEFKKVEDSFEKRIDAIEDKLKREQRELAGDEAELEQRKMEEWGTHAENVLSLFGGRKRRVTTSLSKRRMTSQAKADVEESKDAIEEFEEQIEELEDAKAEALQEVNDRFEAMIQDTSEIIVEPYKKDILIEKFGIAWMPIYLSQVGAEELELPGFENRS